MKQALECKSEKFQLRLNLDAHRISSKNEKGNQIPKINLQRIEQEIAWVDHVLWLATCYFYIKSSTWISFFLLLLDLEILCVVNLSWNLDLPLVKQENALCCHEIIPTQKHKTNTNPDNRERKCFFPYMNHEVFVMLRCRWSLWRIETYQEGTQ
jgi:hypothetical protein